MKKYVTVEEARALTEKNTPDEFQDILNVVSYEIRKQAGNGNSRVIICLDTQNLRDKDRGKLRADSPQLLKVLNDKFPGFKIRPQMRSNDETRPLNFIVVEW